MPNVFVSVNINGRVHDVVTPEQWRMARTALDNLFDAIDAFSSLNDETAFHPERQEAPKRSGLRVKVKRTATKADFAIQVMQNERKPLTLNELGDLMEAAGWKTNSSSKGMRNHGLRVAFHGDERFARSGDGWVLAGDAENVEPTEQP